MGAVDVVEEIIADWIEFPWADEYKGNDWFEFILEGMIYVYSELDGLLLNY